MMRVERSETAMLKTLLVAGAIALVATAAEAGDAKNGKVVFARGAICHTVQKGGPNGLGPNLFGVAGRKAATVTGFGFSSALKNSRIVWTPDKLKQWVSAPARMVPGTKMAFAGISNAKQADDVVAYLASLK